MIETVSAAFPPGETAEIEQASAEEAKPARARRGRKAKPDMAEEPETMASPVTVIPEAESESAPEAAAAGSAASVSHNTDAEEPAPVRANRSSNLSNSEPVIRSTSADKAEDEKPKKAGWWQRRGFL